MNATAAPLRQGRVWHLRSPERRGGCDSIDGKAYCAAWSGLRLAARNALAVAVSVLRAAALVEWDERLPEVHNDRANYRIR